mgnify:CR=1|jgi:hypothetical protein
MAEKYQRNFDNLSKFVKAKYDNDFKINDIPEVLKLIFDWFPIKLLINNNLS